MSIHIPIKSAKTAFDPQAALQEAIAAWEQRFGRSFADPKPTEEELAEARRRADDAVRGLIAPLIGDA